MRKTLAIIALAAAGAANAAPVYLECSGWASFLPKKGDTLSATVVVDVQARTLDMDGSVWELDEVGSSYVQTAGYGNKDGGIRFNRVNGSFMKTARGSVMKIEMLLECKRVTPKF